MWAGVTQVLSAGIDGDSKMLLSVAKRYINRMSVSELRELADGVLSIAIAIRPIIEAYDDNHSTRPAGSEVASDSVRRSAEERSGSSDSDRTIEGGEVDFGSVASAEVSGGPLAALSDSDLGHETEVEGDSLSDGED